MHAACMFGAVASVNAWERVGAALTHLARVLLKVALGRYVDDVFAVERCISTRFAMRVLTKLRTLFCPRVETMEHAVGCVVRLFRLILGAGAVTTKFACGRTLSLLGVGTSRCGSHPW